MTPEIYLVSFENSQFEIHNSHADADAILAANGWEIPTIPPGCNTVTFYFETKEGCQALAINQSGFRRVLKDNEEEVNGCIIYLCLDRALDLIDARAKLQRLMRHIETL